MNQTQLYRHFDADGRLLYVGISLSAVARLSQHERSGWHKDIALVSIEKYRSRSDALIAEAWAINNEGPAHNKHIPECPDTCPIPLPSQSQSNVAHLFHPADVSSDKLLKAIMDGVPIRFIGWDGDGSADKPSARTVDFLNEFESEICVNAQIDAPEGRRWL